MRKSSVRVKEVTEEAILLGICESSEEMMSFPVEERAKMRLDAHSKASGDEQRSIDISLPTTRRQLDKFCAK